MKINTKLAHLGRTSAKSTQSVNPPLVRASTTVFNDLAEFKHSYTQPVFESARYGRSGTQTTFELQQAMAELENTETCIATACGLSAIVAVLGAHAQPGKHILVSDGVYGPTKAFCETELVKFGTEITYFSKNDDIKDFIKPETCLIFIEVPSSITMEMFDIKLICQEAHQHKIPVASDSSWGTPIFFKPHSLGIDISIHAATKYINGHSDVMLGLITGKYEMMESVRSWCDRYGVHAAPDACWLTLRGLRTLAVRMQQHQKSTLAVATWLKSQEQIKRVIYPPFLSGKDFELWRDHFSGCAGPFTVELQACSEGKFEKFINGLTLFSLGTSWGGFESLTMPAIAHHLRDRKVMPDDGRLVRFHIGLEDSDDLCRDIGNSLRNANF
jgi:cysteine-S-conjugate beta-lyase